MVRGVGDPRCSSALVIGVLWRTVWRLEPAGRALVAGRWSSPLGRCGRRRRTGRAAPDCSAFAAAGPARWSCCRAGRGPLWLRPDLRGCWVNVHGSWPIGLGVVGSVLVHRVVGRRAGSCAGRERRARRRARLPARRGGQPVPDRPAGVPAALLGRGDVLRYIVEWRPPALTTSPRWRFVAQVLVAVWAIWRTKAWGWTPLVVVMAVLAADGRRNIPVASLAMVPVMAPAIGTLGAGHVARRRARGPAAAGAGVDGHHDRRRRGRAPPCRTTTTSGRTRSPRCRGWSPTGSWPTPTSALVHPDYVGNYLEWRYGADARVFADDRAEVLRPGSSPTTCSACSTRQRDWAGRCSTATTPTSWCGRRPTTSAGRRDLARLDRGAHDDRRHRPRLDRRLPRRPAIVSGAAAERSRRGRGPPPRCGG